MINTPAAIFCNWDAGFGNSKAAARVVFCSCFFFPSHKQVSWREKKKSISTQKTVIFSELLLSHRRLVCSGIYFSARRLKAESRFGRKTVHIWTQQPNNYTPPFRAASRTPPPKFIEVQWHQQWHLHLYFCFCPAIGWNRQAAVADWLGQCHASWTEPLF